ncbi:MAG: gamma-glutamyltransferase family protein [Candidatus Neomarinimicrobiota bacterium]
MINRRFDRAENFIAAFLVLFLLPGINPVAADGVARGRNGMVATAHPLATATGLEMLQNGGNAIDAAVAAAFTIGVVEPDGSGLGGGGGMVIYLSDQQTAIYINYYHCTSENIDKIEYDSKTDRHTVKSILVPGTVAGLVAALENYGTLPLKQVLQPAIKYAADGFPIDGTLAGILLDNVEIVAKDSVTAGIFLDDGFPLMEGDLLVQNDLARTLRIIAEQGRKGFYEGEVAQTFVDRIGGAGGALTLNDLKNFAPIISEPVEGNYRGFKIISAAAPHSGITLIESLNILENYDLAAMGHFSGSGKTLHVMAETFRRTYADRFAFVEDPGFSNVPAAALLSKQYAFTRFSDINIEKAQPEKYRATTAGDARSFGIRERPGLLKKLFRFRKIEVPEDEINSTYLQFYNRSAGWQVQPDNRQFAFIEPPGYHNYEEFDGHTTHLSVIDKDGNMVSLTQTLGTFFGSSITVSGVLFNCGMSNFSFRSTINSVAPNKRPRSAIAPTLVLKDDRPFMVVGTPGASRIISTMVELLVNGIDFGMDAAEINLAPRFYCQKFEDYLHIEGGIEQIVIDDLQTRGHQVKLYGNNDLFFGGAQLITVDPTDGSYCGSADPRRGGVAQGY